MLVSFYVVIQRRGFRRGIRLSCLQVFRCYAEKRKPQKADSTPTALNDKLKEVALNDKLKEVALNDKLKEVALNDKLKEVALNDKPKRSGTECSSEMPVVSYSAKQGSAYGALSH